MATHKRYWMPNDSIYFPLQVGAAVNKTKSGKPLSLGYSKDSTGDNISSKNANYCELTGLYWAWKNMNADYLGLVHYRRHFSVVKGLLRKSVFKENRVLTGRQLKTLLKDNDIILPKKRYYFIESNYSQYVHAHNEIDLTTTRDILEEKYPDYLDSYDKVMKRTYGHRFNMFIMKKQLMDEYCSWLFDILFELENRLDISGYSANDARVFGFVSERLLDVWIEKNALDYKEIPYIFMENQNWLKKGGNFLKRKFFNGGK